MTLDSFLNKSGKEILGDLGNIGEKFVNYVKGPKLHSNESVIKDVTEDAINNASGFVKKPFMERGIHGAIGGIREHGDVKKAVVDAFTDEDSKKVAWGTIAGSYIAASSAYRVASGGGLYRDKNGNTNIIGVPFV